MSRKENVSKLADLKASKMTVHTDGLDTLMKGLIEVGDEMLQDWLKQVGPEGQRIIDAYNRQK